MEGESKYTPRQLGLLRGALPATSEETSWLDKHSSDIVPEGPSNAGGKQPSIDALSPIAPLTGERADLLQGRPKNSAYPGQNPPKPMPMGGAKDD